MAVATSAVALVARHNAVFSAVERQTVDLRFALRGSRRPPRNIVIVGLDATSLEDLPGQYVTQNPQARRIHAQVLEQLHRAGARVIAYDFAFDKGTGPNGTASAADYTLYTAAQRAAPVVFAAANIRHGQTTVFGGNQNVEAIGDRVGAIDLPPDPDGTVRHLVAAWNGLPSMAVQVQQLLTHDRSNPRAIAATGAWIDYVGGPGSFPVIPFNDVATGKFSRAAVRGKIVLVGATAPELLDLHPTAAGSGEMAGVEIQANVIASLLAGLPLRNVASWFQTLLMIATCVVICACALRGRAAVVAAVGMLAFAGWCVAAAVAFSAGAVLAFTPQAFAIVIATGGALAVAWFEDARERRQLRRLFAAGSELVDQVLGGDSRLRGWASQIIDGYTIETVIARGGMGAVYRAKQNGLGRLVALKVILPELAQSAEHRARFELESRAAAAIEHPNVIPVYDTGDDEHVLYIAMRLVSGGSLDEELHIPLGPARATRIIEQLAGALDAAHAQRIVHRDVKPSNVLITAGEPQHVYLTDFGIAKWLGESGQLTRADGWIGTAAYAAPEQIQGRPVDGRADIYSLTAVLYHCLTAEVPYPRPTKAATAVAHLNDPIPEPTSVNPTLPRAIDAVIAKGLSKDPDDRFATAMELARAAASALGVDSTFTDESHDRDAPRSTTVALDRSATTELAADGPSAPLPSDEETELA